MRRALRLVLTGLIIFSVVVLLVSVLHPGLRRAHLLRMRADAELVVAGHRVWVEPTLMIENAPVAPMSGATPGHYKLYLQVRLRSLAPLPGPDAVIVDSVWLFWGPVVLARELFHLHDYREQEVYTSVWPADRPLPHLDRMPPADVLVSIREGEKRHLLLIRGVNVSTSG